MLGFSVKLGLDDFVEKLNDPPPKTFLKGDQLVCHFYEGNVKMLNCRRRQRNIFGGMKVRQHFRKERISKFSCKKGDSPPLLSIFAGRTNWRLASVFREIPSNST